MAPTDHANLKRSILEVSLQLGTELGEDGLTMRAIARRLGVSATALYQHFDSKAAILRAIRFDGLDKLHAHLAPAFESGTPAQQIHAHCLRYLAFAGENPWLYCVLLGGAELPWDSMTETERNTVMRSAPAVSAALEGGKSDGSFRPDVDVQMAPLKMWASLHGFASLMLAGRVDAAAREQTIDAFAAGVVATLRA